MSTSATRGTSIRRHERRAVSAATVLLGGLMMIWTLVAPAYRAADEPMHVSTVMRLAQTGTYPPAGRALMNPAVLASYTWVKYFGYSGRKATTERPAKLSHPPSMQQLSGKDVKRPKPAVDQMTQHPPAYYLILAASVRLLHLERSSPNSLILGLRLISCLFLLPIPYLCFVLARRMGLNSAVAASSAFLPSAWMQFVHVAATVSNGALLILASSVALLLLVSVAQGDASARRAVLVGLTVSVALLTKGFALALLPLIPLAYVLARRHCGIASAIRGLAVSSAVSLLGLWWWILNLIRYGTLQPKGMGPIAPEISNPPSADVWVVGFAKIFMRTSWVALGWAEGSPPPWLYIGLSGLFILMLAVGSWAFRRQFGNLAIMHLIWLGALLVVIAGSFPEFERSGQVRAAQGRYVQVAVVAFAVLAAAGLSKWFHGMSATPLLVLVFSAIGISYGIYHFWVPADGAGDILGRVDSMLSWWPAGLIWLALGIVTALAAASFGTVTMWRLASTRVSTDDSQPAVLTEIRG